MFIHKITKYIDWIVFFLILIVIYKLVDNYTYFLNIISGFFSIISPFIYAFVFAYMLNPIVTFFERRIKINRNPAICLTYLLIAASIFVGLLFTIPNTIDNIINITKEIPSYVSIAQGWIDFIIKNNKTHEMMYQSGLLDKIQNISLQLGNFAISLLQNSSTYLLSLTSNLLKIILGLLISVYVLIEKDSFLKHCKLILYIIFKETNGNRIIYFFKTYNSMIGTYIGIKAIDSFIIGCIALIGLLLIKAPHAALIALIVGITNMIPYIGPFVGEIIGALISLFTSPVKALIVFILLLCIQQFDAWYLDPKLIGKKVGVSPFGIILAVTIGGAYFGPIGMILASPTMAVIKIYYNKLINKFKADNKQIIEKNKL